MVLGMLGLIASKIRTCRIFTFVSIINLEIGVSIQLEICGLDTHVYISERAKRSNKFHNV